jgi:hypothetical protein
MPKGELQATRPEIRPSKRKIESRPGFVHLHIITFLVSSPWELVLLPIEMGWNGPYWNMDFPWKKPTWFLNSIPLKISHEKSHDVCLFWFPCGRPKMGYTPHMAILLVWRFKENPARFISNVNPGLIDHGLLITGILPK